MPKAKTATRPSRRLRMMMKMRPTTPAQLHRFVEEALGLNVPVKSVSGVGGAPFDYLKGSYFATAGDCVVWASRGGGKTMLGAAATLLDMLFYPGIQIRVLGGSLQQSEKMHEHLRTLLDRPVFRGGGGVVAAEPTARRIMLSNGSAVQLLAGSQRSVRGTRVHILRCDEVEEMDRDVWSAAQMVTRSGICGGRHVTGRIEALSTMHRVGGLMSDLVQHSGTGRNIFRWNALDVIERCPPNRPCEGCSLWADCRGRAKGAAGFVSVDDLVTQRERVSDVAWDSEMMCRRPQTRDSVYPQFSRQRHVVGTQAADLATGQTTEQAMWLGGMDFGLRCPTTLLWAQLHHGGRDAVIHIAAEYEATQLTLEANLSAASALADRLKLPAPDRLDWIAVDPAGAQRNRQSGLTDIEVLRRAGCRVRAPRARLAVGIERVRRRMDHGLLTIAPRCTALIHALESYHFDTSHPHREQPIKDGPDHLCDALRYLVLAVDQAGASVTARQY